MTSAYRVDLGDIEVDGDHELQAGEGVAEAEPAGVDDGLPAMHTSPRIWPSPGVVISSASTDTGSSPPNSGSPRTRVDQAQVPAADQLLADHVDRRAGEHRPPGRSRLPVRMLIACAAHCATLPYACVDAPIRRAPARSARPRSRERGR